MRKSPPYDPGPDQFQLDLEQPGPAVPEASVETTTARPRTVSDEAVKAEPDHGVTINGVTYDESWRIISATDKNGQLIMVIGDHDESNTKQLPPAGRADSC